MACRVWAALGIIFRQLKAIFVNFDDFGLLWTFSPVTSKPELNLIIVCIVRRLSVRYCKTDLQGSKFVRFRAFTANQKKNRVISQK